MKVELRIPINRVEGDLDIEVVIEDNKIVDAKSIGVMYRGFENILKDRDPLDSLVITPRVCGICSVSHLLAAVNALEDAYEVTPTMRAKRIKNLSIMAESMQSDLRQVYLMFMSDFANEIYKEKGFFELANRLYAPFKGEFSKKILDITKEIVKIIAILGGQWPHTSHMLPGGIITQDIDFLQVKFLIFKIKSFLEKEILGGCKIEEFNITSKKELNEFIKKYPSSQIAIFYELVKKTNLLNLGKSGYGFINYPYIYTEEGTRIEKSYIDNQIHSLDIDKITEDVFYSHFEGEVENPFYEDTIPKIKENAYSFAKAPRYNDKVVQTGPLGEELFLGNKLFWELFREYQDSVFVREFARLLRPIRFIKWMEEDIDKVITSNEILYKKFKKKENARGVGLTHAARGALGHWVEIEKGKIKRYQIISPTTWNGSPMDRFNQKGPWEKALIGTYIKDVENPIEMGHIIRSFDPCLVCTVHYLEKRFSV